MDGRRRIATGRACFLPEMCYTVYVTPQMAFLFYMTAVYGVYLGGLGDALSILSFNDDSGRGHRT